MKLSKTPLLLASEAYRAVVAVRNWSYNRGLATRCRAMLPVVSVGNLTCGGNGKTPLALFIADKLAQRGYKAVILSRGYGGSDAGPRLVTIDDHASCVGDEPLFMAGEGTAPVVICRDRGRGAEFVSERKLGDVIILDDGFQHRRLVRDLDIISIDVGSKKAIDDFVAGGLLPVGPFREDRKAGLKRADIVVLTTRCIAADHSQPEQRILRLLPDNINLYRAHLEPIDVSAMHEQGLALQPCRAVAFCAIAKPTAFFQSLEKLGYHLAAQYCFRDHYQFREADIDSILHRHPDLPLICTAKDAVKLKGIGLSAPVYVLNVRMRVVPEDAFMVQICRVIEQHRR